ncbi:TfoX/Sxy family protein [Ekhidna sp.]|uniref:TfoX/Sxy family protein n=1 Tax=Ekhidna sp. TaxID=2608089 RepID=UPI003296F7A6
MAFNEHLADKLRQALNERSVVFEEKMMMGGLCIMVDDKMCIGVIKNDLMARVGPHIYADALQRINAREMDFTKRPMKGYLYVNAEGWDDEAELGEWIDHCLVYNKEAISSKKK